MARVGREETGERALEVADIRTSEGACGASWEPEDAGREYACLVVDLLEAWEEGYEDEARGGSIGEVWEGGVGRVLRNLLQKSESWGMEYG
jgi:hypothetical protein